MSLGRSGTSRYRSLDASRRALARAAPLVRYGLFSVGVSVFLDQVRPLISDAQFTWGERRLIGLVAVVTLGSFGLAAWLAGQLLRASADLIEVFVDGADAAERSAYLIESQLVPSLNRVAAAMERLAEAQPGDGSDRAASAVRKAIADGCWGQATQLLLAFRPGDPETIALKDELERGRQAEADDLLAQLDAALAAGEPDRVIDCRDALTRHLRGDPLKDLDRRVVRWLADLVRKRTRAGPVSPDLAELAARAGESFGDTPEGAALLAAVPDLRRRAGLCPGCGRPYRGSADTCPDCRSGPTTTSRPRPGGAIPRGKP